MKLLHLYDDVMNLYGEYANVAVLARYLTDMGDPVTVDSLSLYERRDITGYDFYYMGAGTERNQKLVLPQLLQYRDALHAACADGKVMLFTGNASELLGRAVTDAQGRRYEGLGFADFESVESGKRITGDCLADFADDVLVGFINKCSTTTGAEPPLLKVRLLTGGGVRRESDGFRKNNCFGTHLIGPLLAKNPPMLRCLLALLTGRTDVPIYPEMEKSYETTRAELKRRIESLK